jgi:hypothetical protein
LSALIDQWLARQAHPNLSLVKSVLRQTSHTDDLRFTELAQTSGGARPDGGRVEVEK